MAAGDESRVPAWVEPMLANTDGGRLRSGKEWAYEYKLDFCTRFRPVGALGVGDLRSRPDWCRV
jgi:bifunctional non-homologous end joining protein LigD